MRGYRQDCVVHVDKNGKILFEHVFDIAMDAFGMLSDKEAILLETRKNCITILNLENHEFRRIAFNFFNEQSDQTDILTFADTKTLCIQENGRYGDNRFKLNYFHYGDDKPFLVYESKEIEWTYEYMTRKANNHSMVCWFKGRHDD